jgi:hypothetical protein
MKKIISVLFCVLTPISLFLIDRYWINQPVQAPVAMDYAEQLKLDDRKNFVTSARTPLEHYQEHLGDVQRCKNFISWLAGNSIALNALADHLRSVNPEGLNFLRNSLYATDPAVSEITNTKGRIDVYSDYHEAFGDAHLEDIQCRTKSHVRLWMIEDFGLTYEGWQIRQAQLSIRCSQIADAQVNPYESPTIESLKEDLKEIRQRYAEVFSAAINKSIDECQKSVRQTWLYANAKGADANAQQAKIQAWITQLEEMKR